MFNSTTDYVQKININVKCQETLITYATTTCNSQAARDHEVIERTSRNFNLAKKRRKFDMK